MLGLTLAEMRLAKAIHIAPERYAEVKAEIAAERDAWQEKLDSMSGDLLEWARYAPPRRGQRPALEAEEQG